MATPPSALLDLSGQVACVTGAGGGIGAVIAHRLAEAGAAVAVHHRSGTGEEVARSITEAGGRAVAAQADLTERGGPQALVDATLEAFGRLDVLVGNAAAQPVTGLRDISDDELDVVLGTNLAVPFRLLRSAAPHMSAGGCVVHIASIEAWRPLPGHAHYAASKAGLVQLTTAAAGELGPHLRVNAVAPGLTWRAGLPEQWPDGVARWEAAAPLGRLVDPGEVADATLFLASSGARGITGTVLTVDAGMTAVSPW